MQPLPSTCPYPLDFKDNTHKTVEYAPTMDSNSDINSIEYNLLNLLKKITFAEANVSNERNHYYPYEALFTESYQTDEQPFKCIGKELDTVTS
ncbi:MAG: hypothetical protein LBN24_12560 [Mediterranea sp.]|jgi:hypothetical protein|nr:hypothetical protein [Mediterranea sp.]